jgi:hypothetical protein
MQVTEELYRTGWYDRQPQFCGWYDRLSSWFDRQPLFRAWSDYPDIWSNHQQWPPVERGVSAVVRA